MEAGLVPFHGWGGERPTWKDQLNKSLSSKLWLSFVDAFGDPGSSKREGRMI